MLLGGFDIIYDTVGKHGMFNKAIRWLKARGTYVKVGYQMTDVKFDETPIWWQELNIIGVDSYGIESNPYVFSIASAKLQWNDFDIDFLRHECLDVLKRAKNMSICRKEYQPLITKCFPIETLQQLEALKQSCYLLRRTSHSCQSLSDGLYKLKNELIIELKEKYNFDFDDNFVESFKSPYLV